MASHARAIGAAALLLTIAPLGAVAYHAGGLRLSGPDLDALRFTLWQAFLSAVFSCLLAIPVARALARRRFFGRGFLIVLMGAPFLLPTIVAVMALLTVFGRKGWLNTGLGALGLPDLSIYGLHGVVLAHVFLNLPLAARMILQGWLAVPAERFRLAESLGFTPRDLARHIERPMLREILPGAFATIFAICLTSFAVALTLGGGPAATTLELAIYQAIRFEFDLGHAAGLALVQTLIGGVAALLAWRMAQGAGFGAGMDRAVPITAPKGLSRVMDGLALILATAFLALPLLALVLRGVSGLADLPASVWQAALRSVVMAVVSALVATSIGLTLALAVARRRAAWLEITAVLPLACSGLVLGTGLFLLVQPFTAPPRLALPVTVLVNSLMSLPFIYRLLAPEARALQADYGRLAAALDMRGWPLLRYVTLPRLARPLGFSAGLTAALSMGDLGVIALFATDGAVTLPYMVQQLMGAFRTEAAAGAALVLVTLSFALFWVFDAGGRRAHAR